MRTIAACLVLLAAGCNHDDAGGARIADLGEIGDLGQLGDFGQLGGACGPHGECNAGLVCDPQHSGCPTRVDADGGCAGPFDDVFATTCQYYRDPLWICDDLGCRCAITCRPF